MDNRRSATCRSLRTRSRATTRGVSFLGLVGLTVLTTFAPGCTDFDTGRTTPKRGSVGEEVYGVLCDRVGAQALREDLSGDSFRAICHKPARGDYEDRVDTSKLPALSPNAVDARGRPVTLARQRTDRDEAIGKIEALGRRRADLIRALEALFPDDEKIAIKDLANPDPTKTCDAPKKSGEGLLVDELAAMLGRMADLYNDGTVPHSTESLARVVEVFANDDKAQKAWARISARQGYRPIETALGPLRPILAYPRLRDFSNASLRLLSADSTPYDPNAKRDAQGNRVPVAGPGNAALNKLLEASHEEFLAAKADGPLPPLKIRTDGTGRVVLSRPRDNLEIVAELLNREDDAFRNGSSTFIVRRDARGYAKITGGLVPAPFVDADKDGLPDVDEVGQFKTSNGSLAPSPFPYPGSPEAARDSFERAAAGSALLYEYIDTSRTFAAQLLRDMKPLVNADPEADHETLMNVIGALPILLGPRETRTKQYGDRTITYDGIRAKDSPLLDFIYALGVILGDRTTDQTLAMLRELITVRAKETARLTGALSEAFDIAQRHPEASIPKTSTFWDDGLEIMGEVMRVPGLLEDVLRAVAAPETRQLGRGLTRYMSLKDEVTYDYDDLNGAPYNLTTKSNGEMKTPVDRDAPITGANRSALHRFLQLVNDVNGVTACNRADARFHVSGFPDIPGVKFKECEIYKLDNLAIFYVDAVANAYQVAPVQPAGKPRPGTIYMRKDILNQASSGSIIESSSGITGMWPTGGGAAGFGEAIAPRPQFLNRLVFFDHEGDRKNEKTREFVRDLAGPLLGTSSCAERVIDDPVPNAKDARPDGKIRGLRSCADGQWLQQRGKNTVFALEQFGFYEAIRPLVAAFVRHEREDLFVKLAISTFKHYPGKDATPDECRLAGGTECTREGVNSYEPLLAEVFATDVIPALSELVKALELLPIKTCTAVDPTTNACRPSGVKTVSGLEVVAAMVRALLDPEYARQVALADRSGNTTTTRNDGTKIAQVTPIYLLTNALTAIDRAFDTYEEQNPNDTARRASWRRARSQLVDLFLGTTGTTSSAAFTNPTIRTMTPEIVGLLRSQLWARCPSSFVPPYETCRWAREELAKKAEESLGGPLATASIDMMDAIRRDPEGRRELQLLIEYLLDAGSKNDALASVLASTNDLVQLLRDEENLVPLYPVIAAAVAGSKYDARGKLTEKSLVDAQMALLARASGKYFDKDGSEICKYEVDPNQVLASVLGKLVTPIGDGAFNGQTPLEVIIDVIADVNRQDPTARYEGTLKQEDYASVSANVVEFLSDPESGLEQLYEVIRQGTKF